MTRFGRKNHGYCCYCKRALTASTSPADTAFTYDHVWSVAHGGRRKVPCCRKCNHLKADLPATDWFWFIDNYPRWWRSFSETYQVQMAIVAERTRRAFAGEAPLSRRLLGSAKRAWM